MEKSADPDNESYDQEKALKTSPIPVAAGIILLTTGIVSLGFCIYYLVFFKTEGEDMSNIFISGIAQIGAGIMLIPALITIMGGIFSLMKKKWGLALTGAIICLFLIIVPYFIASILGIGAVILIIIGRKDFI